MKNGFILRSILKRLARLPRCISKIIGGTPGK